MLIATLVMAITQTETIKSMPYLVSNCMSLATCFVYALIVLEMGYWISILFHSQTLKIVGEISYEIYLVHAFTLNLVSQKITSIFIFLGATVIGAILVNLLLNLMKGDLNHGVKRS